MWFPDLYRPVWKRCAKLVRRGEQERAIRLAQTLVRRKPKDRNAWAVLLSCVHEPKELLRLYDEALSSVGDDVEFRYRRIMVLREMGRSDEAQTAAEDLRRDHASSPYPYLALGRLLDDDGRHDDAETMAREAVRRSTPSTDPWCRRSAGLLIRDVRERWTLLREAADHGDYYAALMVGVFLEDRDLRASVRYLRAAERHWQGGGSYQESVAAAREALRLAVIDSEKEHPQSATPRRRRGRRPKPVVREIEQTMPIALPDIGPAPDEIEGAET